MFHRNELGAYYQSHFKTGLGVEVGVQNGLFSAEILREWKGDLKCVDIWTDNEQYQTSLSRLGPERCIKGRSVDVAKTFADGSLDFVFIDAGHSYEDVRDDLEAWYPKVREGGIMSGHDYAEYQDFGVIQAVDEFALAHGYKVELTDEEWFEGTNFRSWFFTKHKAEKIPRILYTTWVSPLPLPERFQPYLDGWKKLMPDYEHVVIDLENVIKSPFVLEAIKRGKYALAGHYGRCERLYKTGGLYFDIDVEAIKSFDDLLDNTVFIGREDERMVNNAVIGCVAGNPLMKACLDYMDAINMDTPNIELETGPWMFNKLYKDFDVRVYPEEYFYPYHYSSSFTPECVKPNTHSVHHWAATWQ